MSATTASIAPNAAPTPDPRRQFTLPEEDREHLDALNLQWETLVQADGMWLVIDDYPIPPGYNAIKARLALRIHPQYPKVEIDMVYFSPHLALTSGRGIGAVGGGASVDGVGFQQWSRHRTGANPWRSEVDNVGTHLLQVDDWLRRELTK